MPLIVVIIVVINPVCTSLELQQAFNAFDMDKKGYLTPEMVGTILGCFDQTISQTRILEIVHEVDEDGKSARRAAQTI